MEIHGAPVNKSPFREQSTRPLILENFKKVANFCDSRLRQMSRGFPHCQASPIFKGGGGLVSGEYSLA